MISNTCFCRRPTFDRCGQSSKTTPELSTNNVLNKDKNERVDMIPPFLFENIFPVPIPFSPLSFISCFRYSRTSFSRRKRVPKIVPFLTFFKALVNPKNGFQNCPKTCPKVTKPKNIVLEPFLMICGPILGSKVGQNEPRMPPKAVQEIKNSDKKRF